MKPFKIVETCARCKKPRGVRVNRDGTANCTLFFKHCDDKDRCGDELVALAAPEIEKQKDVQARAEEKRQRRAARRESAGL